MTIPRLIAITKYHKQFPSLHVMVAAYLGAGEKPSVDGAFTNTGMDEKGQSLFDLFPQSGMG